MRTTALRELTTTEGPFASVYFDSSHDTQDAAKQLELRWRALRDQVEAEGASDKLLATLDDAVAGSETAVGKAGRAIVATEGNVLVDRRLAEPPPGPVARVSTLPYLLPLARLRAYHVPHVVALADSTGAALRAVDAYGETIASRDVEGTEHPVHKVRGGGEAYHGMQHRVEEIVKQNLDEVATDIEELVSRTAAQVLVLAGEVQARRALHDALPARCGRIAVELDSTPAGRQDERDALSPLDDEVHDVLTRHRHAARRATIERFHAEFDREGGLGVQGLDHVVPALREGNVEVLLVSDEKLADRTVWTGSAATEIALHEPGELDTGEPSEQRADEVLPLAAVAVDAELICEPDELALTDGVGVLLRYT